MCLVKPADGRALSCKKPNKRERSVPPIDSRLVRAYILDESLSVLWSWPKPEWQIESKARAVRPPNETGKFKIMLVSCWWWCEWQCDTLERLRMMKFFHINCLSWRKNISYSKMDNSDDGTDDSQWNQREIDRERVSEWDGKFSSSAAHCESQVS